MSTETNSTQPAETSKGDAKAGDKKTSRPTRLSLENFVYMIRPADWSFRWNTRFARLEFAPDAQQGYAAEYGTWEPLTDRKLASLVETVHSTVPGKWNLTIPRMLELINAFCSQYRREIDPFHFYLQQAAGCEPDPNTLEPVEVLEECFEIEPGQDWGLVEWVSQHLFCGVVARTLHPGIKSDIMPVLIGKQGIGKSRFLRSALPSDELFTDSIRFCDSQDEKHLVEKMLGTAIAEVPELSGLARSDIERVKAFLSTQSDRCRLPYQRFAETYPRRCILVGTTNSSTPLPNDPSGTRRFVTIRLGKAKQDPEAFFANHRRDIWGNAVRLWWSGKHSLYLPSALAAKSEAANRDALNVDQCAMDAVRFLSQNGEIAGRTWTNLWNRARLEFRVDNQKEFRAELQKAGYESVSVKDRATGKTNRLWQPVAAAPNVTPIRIKKIDPSDA